MKDRATTFRESRAETHKLLSKTQKIMASKTVYYECGCELALDIFVKQKWPSLCREHRKPVTKIITIENFK